MTTPRPVRLALSVLVGALVLAGCSAGTDDEPTSVGALPTASGEFGELPTLSFPGEDVPDRLEVEVLSEGDGDVVAPGAAVAANYVGHVWGQEEPFDSSFERGKPSLFSLNSVVPGWTQGIPEHTVGSRLLISIPPELGYGPQGGNPQAGIGAEDTIVFVIDLVDAYNPTEAGQADAAVVADPAQLPVTVVGEPGAAATFTVDADVPEPIEPQLIRIADGTGEPVAAGQQVAVSFVATYWDNTGTESSWAPEDGGTGGPLVSTIGTGNVFDLVIGVPVGSRVLLLAPGSTTSPALSVLVDILGAV